MSEPSFSYASDEDPLVFRLIIRLIEKATGQTHLEALYRELRKEIQPDASFWPAALAKLDIDVQFDQSRLEHVPRKGALVFVSNHPFGVLDGIALCSLVERVRPDFKVLTNAVLLKAEEIKDRVLPIDFSQAEGSRQANAAARRAAHKHLEEGGALVLFPAGIVSTSPDRLGRKPAIDALWQPFAASMIHKAQAQVMPVWFPGQNSRLFQITSHISQVARLALLFHEVRRRIGTPLPVHLGPIIPYDQLEPIKDRTALMTHLRECAEALAQSKSLF
ncbi:MAG: acyltransferase [Alphaproteobacteria bacterium]|nr:acyltransferase [Alphaproteobacteria bacterium]